MSGATFAYSSDQPSILSVNASTGAWAGQSAGTAHVTITASPGGATFTVTATVTHVTYTLTVTPNPITGSSGGTVQLTVMEDTGSGPVDVTADSGTVYSIADTSKATVDVPTLTSISPNTITQGTNASYTFTGTNIKGNETIGGLPTGVTASNYSYTSTTVVCTLTATGSATTGGASLTLVASGRGTSGAQTLTVNVGGGVAPSVGTSVAPALYVHMDYGISLNGSTIASIKDQSANGYSFTQATAAAQPSYVTNAYNGHACARFTAAQYLVSTALLTALQSANFSIMVIGTCVDTSGSGIRRAFMNHGSSTGFGIGEDSAFRWCVVSETFSNPLGIAAGNSALHALIYTGDAPGNNTGYSDSTTGASMGASTRAINTTDAAAIGGTNTGTNLWKGDIACIIAWPSVLSSADIAAAISFARTQFGTP